MIEVVNCIKRKNKKLKFNAIVCLIMLFVLSSVMTVVASVEENSLVTVSLSTDKDSYNIGETADVEISVTNGYSYEIQDVKAQIILPDGVTLKRGSLESDSFTMQAGEKKTESISVYIGESNIRQEKPTESSGSGVNPDDSSDLNSGEGLNNQPDTGDKINISDNDVSVVGAADDVAGKKAGNNPNTGDFGYRFWAVLSILSAMTIVIVGVRKKQGKRITAILLCTAITLSSINVDVFAQGTTPSSGSVSAEKEISINGVKKVIKAVVTYNEESQDNEGDKTVTVTFDSDGGTQIDPVKLEKGTTLESLPQSCKLGSSFIGWYTDPQLTTAFFEDSVITEDITLYAGYVEKTDDVKINEDTTYYEEDCDKNMSITLISEEVITAENWNQYVSIYAFTGDVPDNFNVTQTGDNEYTLTPVTDYDEGCKYRMTVTDDIRFKDLDDAVREYTFKIYKEYSNVVDLNDGIKYVKSSDFTETENEYEYMVSSEYFNEKAFEVEDTICIGDGTANVDENSIFLNIVEVEKVGDNYCISCEDCDVEDVFEDVDIYFEETLQNKYLQENFDTEALEQELYNSEGVDQFTRVLAAMLADSEEVTEELDGESLVSICGLNATDDELYKKDFAGNASPKEETLDKLSADLKDNLKLSVEIGYAENNNFGVPDPDGWCVIVFTLKYEGTIMKRLNVDATFTIKEYMNVSLQGYKSFEFELFKTPELEFDYAANVYSQTDIEIQVLVCSAKKEDKNYKDISEEVTKLFSSDEENDTEGLVAEVQEMLETQGDYIELCSIPFFGASGALAMFSINIEFAFVIKVNFAAGLNSKLSVLEATQIGARGNSSDGSFDMYKNSLWGDDRYSFELTVCGYLGIKAGVEGSLTVSFIGLKRLGEVGVAVELGAYLDMYGYAQYTIVKPLTNSSLVYSKLYGGFYMEAGIYLETKLIARSAIFKVKLEVPLLPEQKWPLFTFGNKELLISLNDFSTTILFSSEKNATAELEFKDIPALTGKTLDITTGEINENSVVSWANVRIRFSNNEFKLADTGKITYTPYTYSSGYYDKKKECTARIYYIGQTLQFTKTPSNSVGMTADAKLMWYDSTSIDESAIGKMFNVNFYKEIEGEKTLIATRKVMGSDYAGRCNFDEMNSSLYTDGKWDVDPWRTVVNSDMEFVYSMKKAQTYVAFTYFDDNTKKWVSEVRVENIGEIPQLQDYYENQHMHILGWNMVNGFATGSMGKYIKVENIPQLNVKLLSDAVFHSRKNGEIVYTATGDTLLGAESQLWEQLSTEEYYKISYFMQPLYDREEMTVTYTYPTDDLGNKATGSFTVLYGMPFKYSKLKVVYPYYMKYNGYSSDGGKTVYKGVYEMPEVYEDITYEMCCDTIYHNVTLQYFDDASNTYKDYATYSIKHGSKIPQEYIEAAESANVWSESTSHTLEKWCVVDKEGNNSEVFDVSQDVVGEDIVLRKTFRRTVKISLDANGGECLFENYLMSFDTENYMVKLGERAGKAADNYNMYTLSGWQNVSTGEIYNVGSTVKLDTPVTLKAIYTSTPKVYTVNVSTLYGTLLNGQQTDNFTGGYDDYLKFVEKYENFIPANVDNEEYTMVCNNLTKDTSDDKLTVTIEYNSWRKNDKQYTLKLDVNGGTATGSTEKTDKYGTKIKLSDMTTVTKTDAQRDYTFSCWEDSEGNQYNADDIITLNKNIDLKAVWIDGEPKEYTITFWLNSKVVDTKKYKFGDTLPDFGTPDEAEGCIFSGWSFNGTNVTYDTKPETMPAMNLTANATLTQCYVSYEFNGVLYTTPSAVKIGEKVNLLDKPAVLDGCEASEWTADGITIENNSFVMPAHDVVLKAESSLKYYDVRLYVDTTEITGSPISAQYTKRVELPEPEYRLGYVGYWQADDEDVNVWQNTEGKYVFIMPAHDVKLKCLYTRDAHNIYYMADAVTHAAVENVIAGTKKQIGDVDDVTLPTKEGYAFNETWLCDNLEYMMDREGIFAMPSRDVYFYNYFYSLTVTKNMELCIKITSDDELISKKLYYNVDYGMEMILPTLYYDGYTLEYSSDDVTIDGNKLTMPTDTSLEDIVLNINLKKDK